MNEQPNQSGFSETACPIGPIGKFEKDSRSFYFARLFHRPYQGRFEPRGGRWTWAAGALKKLSESVMELAGRRYHRISGPEVTWRQAEDDINFLSLKMGYKPRLTPRHFHADFAFRRRRVHIDYVKFIQWGPLSGVEEFLVFADSRFIARGGHCGIPPAGGCYNWPLAAPLGKWLITIESPLEVAAMELVGPQVRFWSL